MDNYTNSSECWSCKEHDDFVFGMRICVYVSPLLVVLGTIGNLLGAIVMSRSKLKQNMTCLYLRFLALVDTACLYVGLSSYFIVGVTESRLYIWNLLHLSFNKYIFVLTSLEHLEAWILVCVSLERMLAVCAPEQFKRIVTKTRVLIQLILLTCAAAGLNAYIFWMGTTKHTSHNGTCSTNYATHGNMYCVWPWINIVFASILPFIIMLICSSAIVITLYQRKRRRNKQRLPGTPPVGMNMSSITAMLICLCTVFLVCSLSQSVLLSLICSPYIQKSCYVWYVAFPIVTMIMYLNYAINFWLYCLSGPLFRAELKNMLRCGACQGTDQ